MEQTGNPLGCYAVAASCSEQTEVQENFSNLDIAVETETRQGLMYARLKVTNLLSQTQRIGPITHELSCSGGTSYSAQFPLNTTLEPSESIFSESIVVCFDGDTTVSHAEDGTQEGSNVARSNMILVCTGDTPATVEFIFIGEGIARYKSSNGVSGTYRFSESGTERFENFVCGPSNGNDGSFINYLRNWFLEGTHGNGSSDNRENSATIGVRG